MMSLSSFHGVPRPEVSILNTISDSNIVIIATYCVAVFDDSTLISKCIHFSALSPFSCCVLYNAIQYSFIRLAH